MSFISRLVCTDSVRWRVSDIGLVTFLRTDSDKTRDSAFALVILRFIGEPSVNVIVSPVM